ncbi:1-deoxy-D-xylulose-5-phosphate synthase [Arsenicicoccus sp. oral taxon 190]|uniref:1-deoxy-D-xylulose-5-phosphate synthase n=1 Tax=Arsenicicoccus sp. oral taxon 190 TaxID=1658671 RepID=UPI000679FFFF|nr:1-deoxy-D-xylulose-5-phosphate synthase [Arsenicicoccus sp. oral taxon 190]AKT52851.1 1-deoxy-D-xylulose-5-phosphate synthase [Arsenicicoccus sp. oral taxon 190]
MGLLSTITSPTALRRLPAAQLGDLATEIREFLVAEVAKTGGHLGPNLGVVELTIALHRVFESPHDTIVFDTGHISYVHKLLTGRHDFSRLRARGGLSGYPSRAESEHDVVENSHASASLSWAEGIAVGRRLSGEADRHTVAVIGDGALTGGMAWEALNNIAAHKDLPLVIVINDNERSYAPTIGGMAEHLATLRTTQGYERMLRLGKRAISGAPVVGRPAFETLHGIKKGLKDIVAPQGLFEDLGLKYIGPVDGHDEHALETALKQARGYGGPVLVHVLTKKGKGYRPARQHDDDQFHAVGVINPETGLPLEVSGRSWTDDFSDALVALGQERADVVALTAAMLIPVGLRDFALKLPDRVFDVGIAEQHAVAMAAGLAYAGMHPVVAIYSTFLNRAFDQLLMDCALHRAGVTFVLDRAGVTGSDGASHNGMWDMTLANVVPGLHLAAPRDGEQVDRALRRSVDIADGPSVIRFAKGNPPEPIPALEQHGTVDVLLGEGSQRVDTLVVGIGSMVPTALGVAERLLAAGRSVRVVDPVWALPVSQDLLDECRNAGEVVVVEDNLVSGGIGSAITTALQLADVDVRVRPFGIPKKFLDHASRGQVLADIGLTPDAISETVLRPRGPRRVVDAS